MCQVCATLNQKPVKPKVYHNMKNWWRDKGNCNSTFSWTKPQNAMQKTIDAWKNFMWDAAGQVKDAAGQVMNSLREAKVII